MGCFKKNCEKRCGCKTDWCVGLCILSWIVLIVCIVLGLLLCIKPNSGAYFPDVVPEKSDQIAYIILALFIGFEAASALCFIIFTKCSPYRSCCNYIRILWLLLHFALGITTLALIIHLTPAQYSVEFLEEKLNKTSGNGLPSWLENLQKKLNCCGVNNTQQYPESEDLEKYCVEEFHSRTVEKGCARTLEKYTEKCQREFMKFAAIMLCIGLIPFVICSLTQRKTCKQIKAKQKERAATLLKPDPNPNKKSSKCNCYDRQLPKVDKNENPINNSKNSNEKENKA